MMSNTCYDKKTPETIQEMFGTIANDYDRANAVLSFNLHRYWNRQLVKSALMHSSGNRYLDLCSGTGDIALDIAKNNHEPAEVTLLDFCKEMLDIAKHKADGFKHNLSFIHGNAEELPFLDNSFDCITISYGIRNVSDTHKCIEECYRVLTKSGHLAILELTVPTNPLMKLGHQCYLKGLLPLIGKLVTKNQEAYEYLCSSIHSFVSPKNLGQTIYEAGFDKVRTRSLTGGIATLITAKK